MISQNYWKDFYKQHHFDEPSQFAQFVVPDLEGSFVDLGCGDGRDLYYFIRQDKHGYGVDVSHEGLFIIKQGVSSHMRENKSPDNVYTRFFWHAIDDHTREEILKWTKNKLYIEARTTEDRPKNLFGKHERNLVDVKQLEKDLKKHKFTIDKLLVGYGMSNYLGEDPHLVRVIAHKN